MMAKDGEGEVPPPVRAGAVAAVLRPTRAQAALLAAACLLAAAALPVQRSADRHRREARLTWRAGSEATDPAEAGFLAMGGFRGIVADILWLKAIRAQEARKYYEIVPLCETILRLQPNFVQVWVYHAWNMAYNLAAASAGPEEQWHWIDQAIKVLKEGARRNDRSSDIYWELGFLYMHRLSPKMLKGATEYVLERMEPYREEGEGPPPPGARADPLDHLRYAKRYFKMAMERPGDMPLYSERPYGLCLEALGEWEEAEKWWLEVIERCRRRGVSDRSVRDNLRYLYLEMMDACEAKAAELEERARIAAGAFDAYSAGRLRAAAAELREKAAAIYGRMRANLPEVQGDYASLLDSHRREKARRRSAAGGSP
ncbi:MAG: hypothetical protein N3A38_00320 [Planctomycetota bacterium]|nr:hypothetical protein [Planctomycetota bacterium]